MPELSAPPFPTEIEGPTTTPQSPGIVARVITALIVGLPFVAITGCIVRLWGNGVQSRDLLIAAITFLAFGHGIAIGYHRLLAHRSFVARRPLKLVLVALGSMAFEGGPIGWVATHRRHHVFVDRPGDPHSPQPRGAGAAGKLRGLVHAHAGWLFTDPGEPASRRAADLLADRDLVVMNNLFPLWCVASLAIPFGLGWILGGTVATGLSAFLWAGLVRVFLLHHVTWSVNSVCHMFGRRPFVTNDRSTNVSALALISMGESWHNGHHAFPRSARLGLLPGQRDTSAALINTFERLGWAEEVNLPPPSAIQSRRVDDASTAARVDA